MKTRYNIYAYNSLQVSSNREPVMLNVSRREASALMASVGLSASRIELMYDRARDNHHGTKFLANDNLYKVIRMMDDLTNISSRVWSMFPENTPDGIRAELEKLQQLVNTIR